MSNKSDHNKPFTDINKYLPEVYRSDLGTSVFDVAFNRHLTADDTTRITGYIGEGNPAALVDRRIKESTPHRQAFQLAPTVYSVVGTEETALSFKAFQSQLSLMGVDIDRMDLWGNVLQFNWVPPINIDMLLNYQDYFWQSTIATTPPQYLTIENRCNKATSGVASYQNMITQQGSTFVVTRVNHATSELVIDQDRSALFVPGFNFFTKDSYFTVGNVNPNMQNKFWTVVSSAFNETNNTTTIQIVKQHTNTPLIGIGDVYPSPTFVNEWFYNTAETVPLRKWTGTEWVALSSSMLLNISLTEQLQVFQAQANCACNQDQGWDASLWDDNPLMWDDALLTSISFPTEADWITANGVPTANALWYDTTNDTLNQYTSAWVTVAQDFSVILLSYKGTVLWDLDDSCDNQTLNEWSEQNRWIHKSEVQSTTSVTRAQLPILEYNSVIELNEWVHTSYAWKYRTNVDQPFTNISTAPSRIELEPIKGYYVEFDTTSMRWRIYLFHKDSTMTRDIDYSNIFVPGFRFRITNDYLAADVYTVAEVEYREITSVDTTNVKNNVGTDVMCTIIYLEEPTFSSIQIAGDVADVLHTRIEPVSTATGDTWRGYHIHWVLDNKNTVVSPVKHQPWNLYRDLSFAAVTPVTTPSPGFATESVGIMHQEGTVGVDGVTEVPLHSSLVYDATTPNMFASPDSNELRVYLNGIRQYGSYTESVVSTSPSYTIIGTTPYIDPQVHSVSMITFIEPLKAYDVVRIELGPASLNDMGFGSIPIRTIEDELEFTYQVSLGNQPTYRSLTQYNQIEQSKNAVNQYPLFNIFDISTSEVIDANPTFEFKEDVDSPINTSIQRRIAYDSVSREYTFVQRLLDRDNNILYAYKAIAPTATYWYSPLMHTTLIWDGYAWSNKVIVTTSTGIAVRQIATSTVMPTTTLDQSLWLDESSQQLYQYTGSSWTIVDDLVVSGADPMLRTIWRHGTNNEEYVPSYVDADLNVVSVGSPIGDWEVVDQWRYNPEHHNLSEVLYSQIVTHFRSILDAQPKIPGLPGGGVQTRTQEELNYFLGGTIKEHNDSYDTLMSAVNVANVTPLGVISFASQEYRSSELRIENLFNKHAVELLSQYTDATFINFEGGITDFIIGEYEINDFAAQIYGDTSAYDLGTDTGVRNWISTIPMFGLGLKYRPHLSYEGSAAHLFHHDGHRSIINYSTAERDRLSRAICNVPDGRTTLGTLGARSSVSYPTTLTAFLAKFGGTTLQRGVYWYQTTAGHKLYRLDVYAVSPLQPSIYDATGTELPDGIKYFNTMSHVVFEKVGPVWSPVGVADDISSLWTEVVLSHVLGEILFEVEMRLYDVTPNNIDLVFDYNTLVPATPSELHDSEQVVFDSLNRERFEAYVSDHAIDTPLVNNRFDISDAFTWNYVSSIVTPGDMARVVNLNDSPANSEYHASAWQELYTRVYGTPYPHLEPWKLQGYYDKPTWWDDEYLDTTGVRMWKNTYVNGSIPFPLGPGEDDLDSSAGMWENIRTGVIPAGRTTPNGDVGTGLPGQLNIVYRYFSVNISDAPVSGYAPDALFPPYFNSPSTDPQVRSLFTDLAQINNPSADYAFGDVGPTEWQWSVSVQRPYDLPTIAFLMQPVKFLHYAFGPVYNNVDELQVDHTFNQVYSHEDALFHGDIRNDSQYLVRGLNQWYVNYNRFTGYDTNTEFRSLWVDWEPRMTYQFGGIVDTSSISISNKYFDISGQDYNVILANSGIVNDLWADAFEVSLLSIPPAVVQFNNQNAWKMELDSLAAVPRSISYYGVRHYPTTVNTSTSTFTVNSLAIVGIITAQRRVFVAGDHTLEIIAGDSIEISGSTGNNGVYTVTSTVYDTNTNKTRFTVMEPLVSAMPNGTVTKGMSLPWLTGDVVVMSSSKFLPAPLRPNTAYYVIRESTTTFKLAESSYDALNNTAIDITSSGDGVAYVSQVKSSFNVFGGQGNTNDLWFHYELDKSDVRVYSPPITIVGMQTLVNIIDGYAEYQQDKGVICANTDANEFDPITGRAIDWYLETERFMDWAFGLRQSRIRVSDRYNVSLNTTTNEFTFSEMVPHWLSGTSITVMSTGALPDPLISGAVYYVVSTGVPGVIKLSTTSNTTDETAHVDLLTSGTGQLSIGLYDAQRTYPRFELNPYRNNIWIDTPLGVLANVIDGPYTDIRIQQTIFDQYSRPINSSSITTLRQDKQSRVVMQPALQNDIDIIYRDDPYNYVHIGGAHMFVEGFEHYLILNDYTADGSLLYDPFLGLYAKRYNLDYFEKEDYTLRPTLGGYYLIDGQFERNIEGAASDMQVYYDALGLSETSAVAPRARGLLGYTGRMSFLDLLNVNSKTQFLFYRGMIQAKGSVNSVNAYINSRRFADARIDEFWAWKIAEFGDAYPRMYPEIKLFARDALDDDIRFQFLSDYESIWNVDAADSKAKGFTPITAATTDRWYEFPKQMGEIKNILFIDAEVTSMTTIYAGVHTPPVSIPPATHWLNTSTGNLEDYTVWKQDADGLWTVKVDGMITKVNDITGTWTYVKLDTIFDDVRVVKRSYNTGTSTAEDVNVVRLPEMNGNNGTVGTYYRINSEVVRFYTPDMDGFITIFTLNPAKSKISPAKLIDKKAMTVVQTIPVWHPALGHHSPTAIHNVDIQSDTDPARYGYTLNPDTAIQTGWIENYWEQTEVGKVWFDTNRAVYVPYYDIRIFPNVNDRLYNWGKLQAWGDIKVYEWTQSTTPPDEWTGSGTPRSMTFARVRNPAVDVTVDASGLCKTVFDSSVIGSSAIPTFVNGDQVIFVPSEDGALPSGIRAAYKYTVVNENILGPATFKIMDPATETVVDTTTTDDGKLTAIKAFTSSDWEEYPLLNDRVLMPFNQSDVVGKFSWIPTNLAAWKLNGEVPTDTVVDVYVNGYTQESGLFVTEADGILTVNFDTSMLDYETTIINIVRPEHAMTTEEESFNPDVEDDGTILVQWLVSYQYSTNERLIDPQDVNSTNSDVYYYFWVENSTERDTTSNSNLSTYEIAQQLHQIPTPCLIMQRPKDDTTLLSYPPYGLDDPFAFKVMPFDVPVKYRDIVIRGVTPYLNDDDRYVVKFTKDWALRDKLYNGEDPRMLKPKHEEWLLFRRAQMSTISRELWDKLTESLMGYQMGNPAARVPSLERELYDMLNHTDTQYGLGLDQTFVDKNLGIATILAYLRDPNNDFSPIDIDDFFSVYSFDTPEEIMQTMNIIYTTFNALHVNAIWFEVLADSLSLCSKYSELLKTSWIALHGIRVLEVGGLFDD